MKVPEKVLGKILKCPRCGCIVDAPGRSPAFNPVVPGQPTDLNSDAPGRPPDINPDAPGQSTDFDPDAPVELLDDDMFPVDTVPARRPPQGLRAIWRILTATVSRGLRLEKLAEQHSGAVQMFGRQSMVAVVAILAVCIFQSGAAAGKLCGLVGFVLAAHGFRLRLRPTDDSVENAIETYAAPAIGYAAMAAALVAAIRWFFVIVNDPGNGIAGEPLVWLCVYLGLFAVVMFTFMGAAQQFGFFRSTSWIYVIVFGATPFVLWIMGVSISDVIAWLKEILMIANEKIQATSANG